MENKYLKLIIVGLVLLAGFLTYQSSIVSTRYLSKIPPVLEGSYVPERVKLSEIPELPELTEEQRAEADSMHKAYVKIAEEESERKSIESMRDEVVKILDEIVEEDSTVTISFNMTIKNPLIYETKEN